MMGIQVVPDDAHSAATGEWQPRSDQRLNYTPASPEENGAKNVGGGPTSEDGRTQREEVNSESWARARRSRRATCFFFFFFSGAVVSVRRAIMSQADAIAAVKTGEIAANVV